MGLCSQSTGSTPPGCAPVEGEPERRGQVGVDSVRAGGRIDGDEQCRAGAGDQVEELTVLPPVGAGGAGNAVGVDGEEPTVLGEPERQRVDPHPAGPFPHPPRRVVARALGMHQAGSQVPDDVAGQDDPVAGCLVDGPVEVDQHLGRGPAAIVHVQVVRCRPRPHLEAPPAQRFEGGEVVLDQLEPPVPDPADVGSDGLQRRGMARVQRPAVLPRTQGARAGGDAGLQRAEPDARTHVLRSDPAGHLCHVGEAARPARVPRSAGGHPAVGGAVDAPAVIDHPERAHRVVTDEVGDQPGVAHDSVGVEIAAVGVVPVVRPHQRPDRQRIGAQRRRPGRTGRRTALPRQPTAPWQQQARDHPAPPDRRRPARRATTTPRPDPPTTRRRLPRGRRPRHPRCPARRGPAPSMDAAARPARWTATPGRRSSAPRRPPATSAADDRARRQRRCTRDSSPTAATRPQGHHRPRRRDTWTPPAPGAVHPPVGTHLHAHQVR